MSYPVVFLFSGQGSQYFQMGKELYDGVPSFRKRFLELDRLVQAQIGVSVFDVLYRTDGREVPFTRTLVSHPAIFLVEVALAETLIEQGMRPDYVIGSSLGEFAAAAVAGVLRVEDALEMVVEQARLFEQMCPPGGMLAVLHDAALYQDSATLRALGELAAVNFDSHFVMSGGAGAMQEAQAFLKKQGILCDALPVSFGFHSAEIDAAQGAYRAFLAGKEVRKPQIPFVSSRYGKHLDAVSPDYFWEVVRGPILFRQAVQALEAAGSHFYIDLGPSGTLAGFTKRNLQPGSGSETFAVMTPFQQDRKNFQQLIQRVNEGGGMMQAFLFPGQGSQKKGMGADLFDAFPEYTRKADEILGYSIKELCVDDPQELLGQTQYTQPALYVVNALTYFKKVQEQGRKPDYVAGHSLGEYNALLAAGAFDFETGLRLVKKRGELMAQAHGGGMAAVIGFTEEQVAVVLREHRLEGIQIANHNSPSQVVVAGLRSDVEAAQEVFENAGVRMYIKLNVSGAFHSRYMSEAQGEFDQFLNGFTFAPLSIPVISNIQARPYRSEDVKRNLVLQITHQVKWNDTIRYLMGLGEMEFTEIGPGNVLSKLVVQIRKQATPLVVEREPEPEPVAVQAVSAAASVAPVTPVMPVASAAPVAGGPGQLLGDADFKKDYGLTYAYVTGSMYRGIASPEMVVQAGRAGMLGFYGTGGVRLEKVEEALRYIQSELRNGEAYGMNLLHNPSDPESEERTVELYLRYGVRNVEASAFMSIVPALILYRAKGLRRSANSGVQINNRILAKLSRPEVAEAFLSPAPERMVAKLLQEGKITTEEAELLARVPMADDITVEADSGGHTDLGVAYALMPAMRRLRDDMMQKYGYAKKIRIGAAGGIGTPEAAAAALMLGADYLLTGSINQCTVEAATSDAAKDLLQQANVQDTDYAPAGDLFEMGAKVQVLKKGLFFPARANKLYDLYRQYNSLDEIDEKNRTMIQEKYFNRTFDDIYREIKDTQSPAVVEKAERNPKYKMACVFRWYFAYSTRLALSGDPEHKVDYQIHCGPALGAFNQWVKGTELENWRNRHVDVIGKKLMDDAAELIGQRLQTLTNAFSR